MGEFQAPAFKKVLFSIVHQKKEYRFVCFLLPRDALIEPIFLGD